MCTPLSPGTLPAKGKSFEKAHMPTHTGMMDFGTSLQHGVVGTGLSDDGWSGHCQLSAPKHLLSGNTYPLFRQVGYSLPLG